MTAFALLSVLVTSGSQAVWGTPIWEPIDLTAKADNAFGLLYALVTVLVATISVNLAANVVSPAYDLSNLAPRLISFRTGALLTGVIGVLLFPWKLISSPTVYIFTWLGTVGSLLGAVAGILVADYWIIRRTNLHLDELYRQAGSRYWYTRGFNLRALAAFAVGGVLSLGGAHSAPAAGPFPADGVIPLLKPLADYGWAVGFCSALAVYAALMRGRRTA
jgi:NCS1 family nucleobase:cation symporter-1